MADDLPEFERPPVVEIVGAVQFIALPRLGLHDMVRLGQALGDYELEELQPQLPPYVEAPPGQPDPPPLPQLMFDVGQQPQRALYVGHDGRFVAQLQRDRMAINDRRRSPDDADPSSTDVWPELEELSSAVMTTLVEDDSYGPAKATLAELTYFNVIRPAEGVWESHDQVHRVLRAVAQHPAEPPYDRAERVAIRFSFPINGADNAFRGRLHIAAEPGYDSEGIPLHHLSLISRRSVDPAADGLAAAFEDCHRAAVLAFIAATTAEMHTTWGRIR